MQSEFDLNANELAHPGKRYQAQALDFLVSLIIFFSLVYFFRFIGFSGEIAGVVMIAIPFSYFVLSDALPGGQSLGKKPFGIHVVSKNTGEPCNILQSFLRNFFSPIFGWIDAILILGKKRQRLGDILHARS